MLDSCSNGVPKPPILDGNQVNNEFTFMNSKKLRVLASIESEDTDRPLSRASSARRTLAPQGASSPDDRAIRSFAALLVSAVSPST